jgi:hypothetical protein
MIDSPEVITAAQGWNEAWQLEAFARGHRHDADEFVAI